MLKVLVESDSLLRAILDDKVYLLEVGELVEECNMNFKTYCLFLCSFCSENR